jgi:hypothetical protein
LIKIKNQSMMRTLLTTFLAVAAISNFSFSQTTITYNISIDSLVGLELTSGDICTPPWATEEAKQISAGNTWGGTWTSINAGTPTNITVALKFSVQTTQTLHPTTLNGSANNAVDAGPAYNCEVGALQMWDIDPAGYVPMGLNTLLVDFSSSQMVNQVDNLPFPNDPYIRVTVTYGSGGGVGIGELENTSSELVKITDLMGRETVFAPNTPLMYIYSDGSVKRVFEFE